nr:RNA polymerase sigma factor [Pontibacter qinzhouensis]
MRLYVDHPEDRKDLYQEIIGQAWKSFGAYNGEAKFSTWLYRVSANTVLLYRRKPVHKNHSLEELGHLEPNSSGEGPSEQSLLLLAAIKQLPETDRLLMSLHLDGYANEEIADVSFWYTKKQNNKNFNPYLQQLHGNIQTVKNI